MIEVKSAGEAWYKEVVTSGCWRVLPEGAKLSEKHRADLKVHTFGDFPTGGKYAIGLIFNDSRLLFPDNTDVRTSMIVDTFEIEGVSYIETRNTLYKLV